MNEEMTQENTQTENPELESNPESQEVVEQPKDEVVTEETINNDASADEQETTDTSADEVSTEVPDEYYSKLNEAQLPAETGGFQNQLPVDNEYEQFKKFQDRQKEERRLAAEQAKNNDFVTKLSVASATIPGFKEKVVYHPLFVDENKNINEFGSQVANFLKDIENPIPILNYSGNEGKEDFEKIKNLRGYSLAKALVDIENKIKAKTATKKISQAPKPIEPVSNSGSGEMPETDFSNPNLSLKERKALRKQQKKQLRR